MGASKNRDFFVSARRQRADDCMDAGDRATQEAKAESGVYNLYMRFEHGADAAIAEKAHF